MAAKAAAHGDEAAKAVKGALGAVGTGADDAAGAAFAATKKAGAGVAPVSGVTHLHHAWPKYLGGPSKQVLERLPKSVHDAYHSGLDKILPRQWGTKYYDNLSDAARRQMERDLADYTKAFDSKYGTKLWQSMLDNGFPGK